MAIISQKKTLATVNSLKVVEIISKTNKSSKTLPFPCTPPHLRMVIPTEYFVSLTF